MDCSDLACTHHVGLQCTYIYYTITHVIIYIYANLYIKIIYARYKPQHHHMHSGVMIIPRHTLSLSLVTIFQYKIIYHFDDHRQGANMRYNHEFCCIHICTILFTLYLQFYTRRLYNTGFI